MAKLQTLILSVVWPHHKIFWFSKSDSTGHSERKKKRLTEEEVGIEYYRVDREGHFATSAMGAENWTVWKGIVAKSFVVPQQPYKAIRCRIEKSHH